MIKLADILNEMALMKVAPGQEDTLRDDYPHIYNYFQTGGKKDRRAFYNWVTSQSVEDFPEFTTGDGSGRRSASGFDQKGIVNYWNKAEEEGVIQRGKETPVPNPNLNQGRGGNRRNRGDNNREQNRGEDNVQGANKAKAIEQYVVDVINYFANHKRDFVNQDLTSQEGLNNLVNNFLQDKPDSYVRKFNTASTGVKNNLKGLFNYSTEWTGAKEAGTKVAPLSYSFYNKIKQNDPDYSPKGVKGAKGKKGATGKTDMILNIGDREYKISLKSGANAEGEQGGWATEKGTSLQNVKHMLYTAIARYNKIYNTNLEGDIQKAFNLEIEKMFKKAKLFANKWSQKIYQKPRAASAKKKSSAIKFKDSAIENFTLNSTQLTNLVNNHTIETNDINPSYQQLNFNGSKSVRNLLTNQGLAKFKNYVKTSFKSDVVEPALDSVFSLDRAQASAEWGAIINNHQQVMNRLLDKFINDNRLKEIILYSALTGKGKYKDSSSQVDYILAGDVFKDLSSFDQIRQDPWFQNKVNNFQISAFDERSSKANSDLWSTSLKDYISDRDINDIQNSLSTKLKNWRILTSIRENNADSSLNKIEKFIDQKLTQYATDSIKKEKQDLTNDFSKGDFLDNFEIQTNLDV